MFNKTILQEIANILFREQYTIAVAESVTAGLLQAALASAENATIFFQGGITAYNARQKYQHLHVDVLHAVSCNCVSAFVASEMAVAVSKSFTSDLGIGITGYASPLPGHSMNPLYAFYAISFKYEIVKAGEILAEPDEPSQVQLKYVNSILLALRDTLK
ncbi:nicotinamide-nucleotide amidohydrolase family protein [Lacibacter sp. H375]|uniref:CinA family protein n=1 Tax=Lacibacter sp. H375 TaxID=3133424 RepID=UPI0030BB779E